MAFTDRFTKSSNPLLSEERLAKSAQSPTLDGNLIDVRRDPMTVSGTANKTVIMGLLMLITASYSYFFPNPLFLWGGAIGGLALVFWMSFKPQMSATLAPIYALLEGLFVGGISALYAGLLGPGVIFQAVLLTLSLLFAMLFVYQTGLIKVTEKFRSAIMIATGGILLVYVINIVLSFFGLNLPFLHEGGVIGIGISLFIIGIATLNLLLDFDNIERGAAAQAPKYMEWFCAMGLIVTLVWIYVEVLRLLSILAGDD